MDPEFWLISASLAGLAIALGGLSVRGLLRFARGRTLTQLWWGVGLGLGSAGMVVELVTYLGVTSTVLLQLYIFLSAGIVGILSLGSACAYRSPRFEKAYTVYQAVCLSLVLFFSFDIPVPAHMVTQGIITGNPALSLLILSSLVTVPATVVLLLAAVLSLRRAFRWRGLLILIGASVLGAGGAFYIASFPVALYYAEFIGIITLFFGLVDLSKFTVVAPVPTAAVAH
jgi:hypothetical protein